MPLPDISLKELIVCHVHTPMYEYNNKKYIRLTIPDGTTCSVRSAQSRVFSKKS